MARQAYLMWTASSLCIFQIATTPALAADLASRSQTVPTLLAASSTARTASSWQTALDSGQSALDQQDLPRAEELFRLALNEVQKQPHTVDQLAKCLNRLADTLALRNKTGEANATYQKLLNVLEAKYGGSSTKLAPALIALGSVQESEGDHAAAMPYYQRALQLNERNYGPYSPEVVSSLHRLARSTYRAGQKESARAHYKRAMSIAQSQTTPATSAQLPFLISDYKDLIKGDDQSSQELLQDFKKDILPARAAVNQPLTNQPNTNQPNSNSPNSNQSAWQSQSDQSAANRKSFQTDEEPKILLRGLNQNYSESALSPAYRNMNEAIFDQSHYGKGEAFYQRKIAADLKSLGNNHPSLANDLSGLALFYMTQTRYADADALLVRALSIYKAVYGPGNILSIRTLSTLASARFHQGKVAEAEEFYRSALSLCQSNLGPNNIETARVLNDLAYLYFSQNKLRDAQTVYQWALASTAGAVGANDALYAACLKDYAQVLRGLGSETESLSAEVKAKEILTK